MFVAYSVLLSYIVYDNKTRVVVFSYSFQTKANSQMISRYRHEHIRWLWRFIELGEWDELHILKGFKGLRLEVFIFEKVSPVVYHYSLSGPRIAFQNIEDEMIWHFPWIRVISISWKKNHPWLSDDDLGLLKGHCVSNKMANLSSCLHNKLLYQLKTSDSPERKSHQI